MLSVDNLQEGVFIIFCLLLTTAISHNHCHWRRDGAFVEKRGKRDIICKFGSYFTSYVRNEDLVDLEKKLVPTQYVRVILILKISFLQLLHGFKLFHLVSDFQNSFCF